VLGIDRPGTLDGVQRLERLASVFEAGCEQTQLARPAAAVRRAERDRAALVVYRGGIRVERAVAGGERSMV
ncbi:MAG: hypothetical protein ACOCYP_06580, partial [Planctomycetota bacterium]